jgi:hypothetical protein
MFHAIQSKKKPVAHTRYELFETPSDLLYLRPIMKFCIGASATENH